jgi:hypothetical protein
MENNKAFHLMQEHCQLIKRASAEAEDSWTTPA